MFLHILRVPSRVLRLLRPVLLLFCHLCALFILVSTNRKRTFYFSPTLFFLFTHARFIAVLCALRLFGAKCLKCLGARAHVCVCEWVKGNSILAQISLAALAYALHTDCSYFLSFLGISFFLFALFLLLFALVNEYVCVCVCWEL